MSKGTCSYTKIESERYKKRQRQQAAGLLVREDTSHEKKIGTRETVVGAGHDRIEERCHKVTGGRR